MVKVEKPLLQTDATNRPIKFLEQPGLSRIRVRGVSPPSCRRLLLRPSHQDRF